MTRLNESETMMLLAFYLLALGGWVLNVVAIYNHFAWPPDGKMILRVVGIFVAPLGVVLGFL